MEATASGAPWNRRGAAPGGPPEANRDKETEADRNKRTETDCDTRTERGLDHVPMSDQRTEASIAPDIGCLAATPASVTRRASFLREGSRKESGSGRSRMDGADSTLALLVPLEVTVVVPLPLEVLGAMSTRRRFDAGAWSSAGGGRERMKWAMDVNRGVCCGVAST